MRKEIDILVVDDDPDILFAIVRIIQKAGYRVTKASTGGECMAKVRENKPDLIFMDVMLPDANGADLCRQIKADPHLKSIFVVLISGTRTASDEQADGLDLGADGYIARPIGNRELLARVNAMVRIASAEKERDRLIVELRKALAEVKTLNGLLPICSHCKKIRDDTGYWNHIEAYIEERSEAAFSHSICRECAKKHYPDMDLYDDKNV